MPKTWDCFNFLNENDLLEIRVNQHWDHVDHFIILEAGQTHTGMPKPFLFDKQRFEKYSSKIIYETIDTIDELLEDLPNLDSQAQNYLAMNRFNQNSPDWVRDHLQGNHHVNLLKKHGADLEDVILITPVDEIVSNQGFFLMNQIFEDKKPLFTLNNYVTRSKGPVRPMFGFNMRFHFHKLNLYRNIQCCGQVAEYSTLLEACPTVARSLSASTHPCLGPDMGWHFSCMDDGTGEIIFQKYRSWAHSKDAGHGEGNSYYDMNTPEKALARVKSDFDHLTQKVEINYENHPAYLVDNQEKFKNLIA